MDQDMEQTTAAEQRAFAVAKLKRAASLPRMKDGRRPPMHVAAVSEGEKAQSDEKDDGTPTPEESTTEHMTEVAEAHVTAPDPTMRSAKRRSRSRSRSRGSKDLRGKATVPQSPTSGSVTPANDSSPNESPLPALTNIPATPPLISPIPSHFAELTPSRLLLSPPPTSPELSPFYPVPSPTPMVFSLEALQKGVMRSNSAAARMMAMHKLTGGTEVYDQSFPSPSPTPPPSYGKLGRNNTVSGGERLAARKIMLRRLGERLKEVDGEQTSGGEEVSVPSPPKRRRRRSRRGSAGATTGPSDSEFISTSPNTPVVPQTPLPLSPDNFPEPPRSSSATPSQNLNQQSQNLERSSPAEYGRPRRRSVVVEDDDGPDEDPPLPPTHHGLPGPSQLTRVDTLRTHHGSDAPSSSSRESGVGVPVYLSASGGTPDKQDRFPTSPFTTPLKEKPPRDDDEEQVLYQAETHQQRQFHDAYDREISWVAEAVPVSRMPIHDDDVDEYDDDDDEPSVSATSSKGGYPPRAYDDTSPRASSNSKDSVIGIEASPEVTPLYLPPSRSSVAAQSQTASVARASDDSTSPPIFPARLSVASRIHSERSPLSTDFADWDDARAAVTVETTSKRNADGGSTSTWEKVKSTFTRSNSNSGRRSRTNSMTRERRDHTDSSVSRESGASLTSAKTDKGEPTVIHQQIAPPLMQSPSASASILSLAPHTAPHGGVSPVPPASSADLAKYQNAKLFPFPGMRKLEEQRNNRTKGILSASTPDITMALNGTDIDQTAHGGSGSSGNTPAQTPEMTRDRKLSHQASDTRLIAKFSSPPLSAAPSTSSHADWFHIPPHSAPVQSGSASLKLPTNREGVKKWLSAKKLFSQVSSPSASTSPSPAVAEPRLIAKASKKPSLSDLLRGRKENELTTDWLTTDWEEISNHNSRTPTSASGSTLLGQSVPVEVVADSVRAITPNAISPVKVDVTESEKTLKATKTVQPLDVHVESDKPYPLYAPSPALPSPPEHASSVTPDPSSSLDDYPPHSTSESSSTTSSQYSALQTNNSNSQGAIVLQRLDEMLGRGSRSPMWASAIDDPPRKLLLSSPVLQVVNANTVKDRFLFLFSDLLVIAKPIMQDQDNLIESYKPNPLDRKFIVKSVVLLRQLRFNGDREEPQAKMANYAAVPRSPLIRTFVHQFSKDPDRAITSLFEKAGVRDDPIALGQLLFRTLDLDRARLGDYLSRRTSKVVLKAYVDDFGFTGLRVDSALRVFLYSINVPASPHNHALEYLLDAFASRWYEANAGVVAYDKDLAIRLVRAIVQLNDMLHGGVAQEPGPTGYPRRNISSRSFLEAFRRYDARGLVSDDLLETVYNSVYHDRLCQARNPSSGGSPDIPITIKRALPTRLTYRVQSEPIILRIPQPDKHLSIQLYGQDMTFEPPVLHFGKSSEASFRVTGTSLGSKVMIMWRSGPNALRYSGLPLSSSLMVERAFMRNTFQVAFANPQGVKRRYMFSVDDPLIRHQWTVSLRRQIDTASSSMMASISSLSPGAPTFHRAAEGTAFKVLQETLLGPGVSSSPPPADALDTALHRLTSRHSPNGNASRFSSEQRRAVGTSRNGNGHLNGSVHVRSKSRSQVYHQHGAGKMELELSRGECEKRDGDGDDGFAFEDEQQQASRGEGRLWSGRDLEMQCQQNSSVALVLAYLQVGAPDHDHRNS